MEQKEIGKIWKFFVNNHKFTYIIIAGVIILGTVSILQIPQESSPEVEVPYALVMTPYPGASPEDVEELVTDPIEDKIKSLDELDIVTSESSSGLSFIFVQFDIDADVDQKVSALKEAVDEAKTQLPSDASDPSVRKLNFSDTPVLTFSLSGPFPINQLVEYAKSVQGQLESISGVSKVKISGGQDREISVIVDKVKLDGYGLPLSSVTSMIASANSDIPAGSIETSDTKYLVRFAGRLSSVEEISRVPIASIGDTVITVNDLAEVVDGYVEAASVSRLSLDGGQSQSAVSLSVYKVSGGNIVNIERQVMEILDQVKGDILPEGIEFEVTENMAQYVREDLSRLSANGLSTIIIIIVLLLIFLGWQEAILTGLAVPMTFLITFIFLYQFGYTINFLSLFSLILGLGMLVDCSIVVSEGINKYRNRGVPVKEAVYRTIEEFQWPLIAGTLTTVFAFLPMMFVGGIIGKFIESIPFTITVVLIGSFAVSLGFLTTISARVMKNKLPVPEINFLNSKFQKKITLGNLRERLLGPFYRWYQNKIESYMRSKAKRTAFIIVVLIAFVGAVALPVTGLLEVNMFPISDYELIYIDMKMPAGTPLTVTDRQALGVENILYEDNSVKSFLTVIGSQSSAGSFVSVDSNTSNQAYIIVKLKEEREKTSAQIADEYNEKFKSFTKLDITISLMDEGPPAGAPVEIKIIGPKLEVLESLAKEYEKMLNEIPGTKAVSSSVQESPGEFVITIDRLKAQLYGVSTMQIAATLRNAISGTSATVLREGGDDIDVVVKYDLDANGAGDKALDINAIESIDIATLSGGIPISSFTDSGIGYSRPSISHLDGDRIMTVTSDVKESASVQDIYDKITEKQAALVIPEGYIVSQGGETEDIQESFTDLLYAFVIGVVMIGSLLVLQFKSFRKVAFILVTIPLALIGVLPGLFLVNMPLSFPAAIGLVALAGVVVNNAIFLIDKITSNIAVGMSKPDAIADACMTRVRPILLTTITTVCGILPLAMSDSTWGPLGYSIVFGLSFSMVLTLMVVPILYLKFGRDKEDV
ncbi:MAG TPA: efflux RND transporter permease subunit [Candidatus Bipolaricaulota bacterium]|nr:efflux RND transporter permease subunit [Candidatus Bipolaricaulota bacterium]